MIYIDKKIRLAISSLKQICVTNDATGERLGVSGKHISQILKGEVESIRPSTWETMKPALRPFLHQDELMTVNETAEPYCSRDPQLRNLCDWLEHHATDDQTAAVFATARAVGFQSPCNSHSGRVEYPSVAKAG
jgi:hypothetical protein